MIRTTQYRGMARLSLMAHERPKDYGHIAGYAKRTKLSWLLKRGKIPSGRKPGLAKIELDR